MSGPSGKVTHSHNWYCICHCSGLNYSDQLILSRSPLSEGQWQGVCGVRPNSEQLQEVVTTKDLYMWVEFHVTFFIHHFVLQWSVFDGGLVVSSVSFSSLVPVTWVMGRELATLTDRGSWSRIWERPLSSLAAAVLLWLCEGSRKAQASSSTTSWLAGEMNRLVTQTYASYKYRELKLSS